MSEAGDFWQDPYPTYEAMREQGVVHFSDDVQAWIVTGHEAARAALTDPALSSRWLSGPLYDRVQGPAIDHVRDWLIWQDPPTHQALRAQVASLFTARTAGARSADIRARVGRDYHRFVAAGGGDAVAELAVPLVGALVADLVGLEGVDPGVLRDWSAAAGTLMARAYHRPTLAAADAALEVLTAAVAERADGGDEVGADRAGDGVGATDRGSQAERRDPAARGARPAGQAVLDRAGADLPGAGVAHLASLFAFAGIETTSQAAVRLLELAATGALPPHASPEQAVAMVLRLDTPVPQVPRVAVRDTELLGRPIAAGDPVVVILAAANHDPEVFADPERPGAPADAGRHLAYGHGRHRCLGAPLADGVLAALVQEVRRHPAPRLVRPAVWHRDRGHRGIARLDLAYDSYDSYDFCDAHDRPVQD